MVLRSSNRTSVIKQFNISCIFLLVRPYHYMKNLLSNIYFLNNKQGLKAHLNET